ncbi:TraR/DksA family transcriptional regulator [Rhizobium subbaraonis]|uniref:TraR/DksA family transcriptional regulator n=1 Tax=Rhizobium subbaraonis TaxID=908946 RepID=A0A285UXM4_9HYPH|nr:TraR/DksA C4-type zinc finger protein [Rhizobium subbaraonis]SOC46634.1 TraR/DksA family transcriptional regulator [Rhizobium subbaraonis]
MNFGGNNSLDSAALREQQERDALVADASAVVRARGSDVCVECDRPIPIERRRAAPFAKRCIECQEMLEAEKFHR